MTSINLRVLTQAWPISAFALAMMQAAPLSAQTSDVDAQSSGDTIVVTGTRRTDRTIADSPVPIDVISGEALVNSGFTETNRLLNQLVPSFNFPQPSLTDGTDSLRPATLRGLSPDQVLVLVNGKRRHISALLNLNGSVGRGSAGVDLNTIPPLAIDRIEVLRDGAASLYGSDAIAGVINVQLRKGEGGRGQITFGKYVTTMDGVPEVASVAPTTGAADNPRITFTGEDRQRRDGDTVTLATNIGLPIGEGGFFNFTAEYKDRSPTQRSGVDFRRQYVAAGDPREVTIDRYNHRYGDGQSRDFNFFINAGLDLGESFELYSFASYGLRNGNGAGFYRRANDARNRDFANGGVPFYPDGFLPIINSEIEDISTSIGIRGEAGGWNLDLSALYGSNRLDYIISNSFNTSLGGNVSKRVFDSGGLRSRQTVINFDARRDLNFGFAKPVSLAVGAEYRKDTYVIRAGEEQSFINGPFSFSNGAPGGAQVFPGFRPSNAGTNSRDAISGYIELDSDLTDQLTVQVAGRAERFSDFGSTVNGKFAARFEPINGIALRGAISTGFRAPGLAQQFFEATSTNNVGGVLIEIGTFPVDSLVARALGAQPLEAEKSVNFGGGVTITAIQGLDLTVDYYNIKINDRITLTENLQGADVVSILTAANITGVTSARFFVNGIDTRTQGIDIVGSYRVPDFGLGKIRLSVGYNLNDTNITSRRVFSGFTAQRLFARQESFRLTDGQPQNKLNIGLDWDIGKFGLTARTNRYGEVFLPGTVNVGPNGAPLAAGLNANSITIAPGGIGNDVTLSPKWVTDLEVRLQAFPSVQLALGANNLFDVYPDRLPFGTINGVNFGDNNSFLPYSGQSPFGFSGRFLYGRVSFDF